MAKITRISTQVSKPDRLNIFIDGEFCCGIRERTFKDMGLETGSEITCEELKKKESFFWKQKYGQASWDKEKVRINKIKEVIEGISDKILITVVGFGADTNELIEMHPEEQGSPDLNISLKENPENILMKVEVTGTERLRGAGYWVRPDKLEYAEHHPEENIWIALHYADPETFRFIKPVPHKVYQRHNIEIAGAGEIMCIFNDGDEGVHEVADFIHYVKQVCNIT